VKPYAGGPAANQLISVGNPPACRSMLKKAMTMHRPGAQRALIAAVQVLGLAVWFSASAVVPALREAWDMSAAAAVWLTASVQLGFVTGAVTSTALNLADRVAPHRLMAVCAALAAACTALFALAVEGLAGGVPLRFLTGLFLAGVYPVGMKLTASWSAPAQRGRAFGVLIGALTLGSALPHLIGGLGDLPWRGVMAAAAGCAALGAVVAATLVREGPQFAPGARPRPHPRYALTMFAQRGPRLVNLGYFGHMWELYALWTWLPAFLIAGASARGGADPGLLAFVSIGVAGVAGCLAGGWAADRFGRPRAAFTALVVSGACCLVSPLFFGAPPAAVAALGVVWGAAVIADSGVFSTSLSEVADPRYVGTALTAQTAIGFALTVVTIQLVPVLAEAVGWRWAFWLLAPGPLVGALAMRAFAGLRPAAHPAPAAEPRR
jgi:MFS family permease